MKKALQLASVASMIDQFNMPNIELLQELGYHVDVVADYTNPGNISNERSDELQKRLKEMGAKPIDIPIPRSMNPFAIYKAYKLVKALVKTEHYDLIHCHSPIGGAIARWAAKSERKTGTKVIYTAHGFHFYDGAPFKNWIIFYPVEKFLSRYTDVLITINKEDYNRAKKKFRAKKTMYFPGIGVNVEKFAAHYHGDEIRKELGIDDSDLVFLSVGELNNNKNHENVIKALGLLKREALLPKNLYYVIVGKGDRREELEKRIIDDELEGKVKLVGFRQDIADFYAAADVFVFPSFREGLSVSLMEAMASGLPVICSRIRGNTDLIDEQGGIYFEPDDVQSIAAAIQSMIETDRGKFSIFNVNKIKQFDLKNIKTLLSELYKGVVNT